MNEKRAINQLFNSLPKAELHLHIEGTLEPEMMFSLANRNNITISYNSAEEIRNAYKFNNLQEFLDIYYQGANVLQTKKDFYDLTFAYLKRASEDNIVHTEFFFDPQTHTDRGISFNSVIEGIYEATVVAESQFGITSFIIMSFLRHLTEEEAFETLKQSIPFKNIIKGIGLDSSELGNPPTKFARVYKEAKNIGYRLVAHAGEEGPTDYIWSALKDLNIERIDHGNTALKDDTLVKHLVENKIPLTICPLSNLSLKVVEDLKNHPLKEMLELGLMTTINSDDPAYFGGYLNTNFEQLSNKIEFSHEDIITLVKNSFKASMLDEKSKSKHLNVTDDLIKKAL